MSTLSPVTHPAVSIPGQAFTIGAIAGTLFGLLPPILAVLAGIVGTAFYAVSLWESKTVQTWWKNREFARLKAKQARYTETMLRAQARAALAVHNAQLVDASVERATANVTADILHDVQVKTLKRVDDALLTSQKGQRDAVHDAANHIPPAPIEPQEPSPKS